MGDNEHGKNGKRDGIIALFLFAALLLPRLARYFYPEADLEDASYLDIIACLSRGQRPYVDFVNTHFVFPEILLALLYRITWPTYRVTEAVTALVVTSTAIVIYFLGKELRSRRLGIIAAALYATHPIFFKYHLYEKEIYEAFFASLLALLVWRRRRQHGCAEGRASGLAPEGSRVDRAPFSKTRGLSPLSDVLFWEIDMGLIMPAALLCFLGFLSKIDFASQAAFICLYILVIERRAGDAFAVGVLFLALACATVLALFWAFGKEPLNQILLFHFFKGRESLWWHKLYKWVGASGYLFFLSVGSIPFLGRFWKSPLLYILFWIAGPLAFFFFVLDTFWVHNIISLMPPFSILGAVYIDECAKWLAALYRQAPNRADMGASGRRAVFIPVSLALIIIASGFYVRYMASLRFGFGYASRSQFEKVSALARENSTPGDIIVAPPIVAAVSNRTDIIHTREIYPVYLWAMSRVRAVGLREARREALQSQFRELYSQTANRWTDMAWEAIESRRAAVVVADPGSAYERFNPDPGRMTKAGYKIIYSDKDYIVWIRG